MNEIAPGVHYAVVGKGFLRANVFFVRSGGTWSLIDAGSAAAARETAAAAESLFGAERPPEGIFLTHDHPDHSGAARELAAHWDRPVWVHPDELPQTRGDYTAIRRHAHPLDRWIVLPLLRLRGLRRARALVERSSAGEAARALDPGGGLPGLPDWELIPTPGHTPGHVAFFRREDGVLIAGDALVNVALNSWRVVLPGRSTVSLPPWYTTWDWDAAKRSAALLARLEPRVLASGHGSPLTGPDTAERVRVTVGRAKGDR